MIGIQNLDFSYPDNTSVLSDFNWNVENGESWSVLGLSGSGKTTLLFLLSGLIKASGGDLLIARSKITRTMVLKPDLLRFVYFPASVPAILTAVRVSVGTSLAVLFIAEQSLTEYGLGYFIIVRAYQSLRYKEMYAGILAISFLGFLLYYLIDILEWRVSRHRQETDGQKR